jgi:hypothetical protein
MEVKNVADVIQSIMFVIFNAPASRSVSSTCINSRWISAFPDLRKFETQRGAYNMICDDSKRLVTECGLPGSAWLEHDPGFERTFMHKTMAGLGAWGTVLMWKVRSVVRHPTKIRMIHYLASECFVKPRDFGAREKHNH